MSKCDKGFQFTEGRHGRRLTVTMETLVCSRPITRLAYTTNNNIHIYIHVLINLHWIHHDFNKYVLNRNQTSTKLVVHVSH